MDKKNKFYLTANITMAKETEELQKEVASVIDLPKGVDKQPDLSYFSAILVSTGTNLNGAHFLGSELVAAKDTIVGKALDIEHEEQEIIGHMYSSAFTDSEGNELSTTELSSKETATLDTQAMHIQIGSIVYKNRFPELAEEIANNEYKVSMECYFTDYDIKVGDMIIPKEAASSLLGIDLEKENIFGKVAKVIKDGKEVAEGEVARVLRGICFSGCGIVKNPANPPSIILETATETDKDDTLIFDLDVLKEAASDKNIEEKEEGINVTSKEIEVQKEESEIIYNNTTGICVSYKKRLEDKQGALLNENWCTEFSQSCTSPGGDATDQDCLRNKAIIMTASYVEELFKAKQSNDTTKESLGRLQTALKKAVKVV